MEAFGIAIALVGGIFAAPIFCFLLVRVVSRFPALAKVCFWGSAPIFALFSLEAALVFAIGVISTRVLVGPAFFLLHAALTFAAAPALACLLLLGSHGMVRGWPAAAVACWFVGAYAIFHQYDVAETLYGIDGSGGPYQWPW